MSVDPASLAGYPLAAFSFSVRVGDAAVGVDAAFKEVSGISNEMQTDSLPEGGENRFTHQLPKGGKPGRLSLKRGLFAADSPLAAWCRKTLEGGLGDAPSSRISLKNVQVSLLGADGQPARTWSFVNAYPLRWEVEGFSAVKNEVAVEHIELAYQYFTLVGG